MSYTPNTWEDRIGTGLNKFTDQNGNEYEFTPNPDSITQQGTPFSADWLNHIEQGIADVSNADYAKSFKLLWTGGTAYTWQQLINSGYHLFFVRLGAEVATGGSPASGSSTTLYYALITFVPSTLSGEANQLKIVGGGSNSSTTGTDLGIRFVRLQNNNNFTLGLNIGATEFSVVNLTASATGQNVIFNGFTARYPNFIYGIC